ncbi:ammonia-forming cytochrome c nitrite reductase subunit c552 [Desulfosporosinus sp. BICA1-9]|uniref:ammonia-forming cytochrome c nitrite reductase subunit c552 n=1 Tax=Desulfosporosinus sp. BICA1-9 TaxID=1531958 RepID=UPI00054BF909|nr:ammonia-forming cytochrome c nitrite reductase subunit c552 [Desulfosporosinus sp. BICA1-9]KJS48333.1 MAG: cytochrome C nitrite reductase [Peptococcaceae bacterium BRH_c23]KJS85790.1 MAG: cytochrome C nitrite reductase [Desulfosporosinus sp. BICA1-9]HBW34972.1 ammonia-forming cytochrome c nitrite reductase subunit c552 [Desulfosporosinus sp.]
MQKFWRSFMLLGLILTLSGVLLAGCTEKAPTQPTTATIPEGELDPAVWGKVYPDHYASYLKQKEQTKGNSKYGGSLPESHLKESPAQVKLFAGYPFSEDYNEERGHIWALEDVTGTLRIGPKTISSCWNCKSPNVKPLVDKMGDSFWSTPFAQLKDQIKHPIACANCHDPKTMALAITSVPLLDALKTRGIDPAKFSRQEMRTMVCAQCHVEYYFKPDNKKVTFPWNYGLKMEDAEKLYEEISFKDWDHKESQAPMLKAQHPDYELFSTGVHAANGVACADCHMPYVKQGQAKISSHHLQSPLNHISQSCQTCHKQSEEYLKNQVIGTQDAVYNTKVRLETALSEAIDAIATAAKNPAAKADMMNQARSLHRKAQWRWDFISAENSMGWHSPKEALRILGEGIDLARQAQLKANLGVGATVGGTPGPDAGKTPGAGTAAEAAGPETTPKQ